jgi:hypothetical protein
VSKEEKEKFIQAWLKALSKSGHKVTVLPVSEVAEDKKSLKLDERIFKADLVVFSARPFGIFVVEDSDDVSKDLGLMEMTIYGKADDIKNFEYLGYIGWKTKTSDNGKDMLRLSTRFQMHEMGLHTQSTHPPLDCLIQQNRVETRQ